MNIFRAGRNSPPAVKSASLKWPTRVKLRDRQYSLDERRWRVFCDVCPAEFYAGLLLYI